MWYTGKSSAEGPHMFSSHNPSYQNKAHNFLLLLFHGGYLCLFILGFLFGG